MEEIQKFDPNQLMQGVKDRIKATFVSLIPDAHWELMVKGEIDKFFHEGRDQYGHQTYPEFRNVVAAVVREEVTKLINEILKSEDFMPQWKDNKMTLPDLLRDAIIKKAPEMFMSMIESAVANSLSSMRSR